MNNGIETPQPGGTIFRELKRVAGLALASRKRFPENYTQLATRSIYLCHYSFQAGNPGKSSKLDNPAHYAL